LAEPSAGAEVSVVTSGCASSSATLAIVTNAVAGCVGPAATAGWGRDSGLQQDAEFQVSEPPEFPAKQQLSGARKALAAQTLTGARIVPISTTVRATRCQNPIRITTSLQLPLDQAVILVTHSEIRRENQQEDGAGCPHALRQPAQTQPLSKRSLRGSYWRPRLLLLPVQS
jgi:hypothetical protein